MSAEFAPTQSTEVTDNDYIKAEQKQQLEMGILAGGEAFDQARVDAILGQKAFEASVPVVEATEVSPEGTQLLNELAIPATEEDNAEVLVAEAARRQLELETIFKQRDLEERALKNNWTNEKLEQEQAKLLQK